MSTEICRKYHNLINKFDYHFTSLLGGIPSVEDVVTELIGNNEILMDERFETLVNWRTYDNGAGTAPSNTICAYKPDNVVLANHGVSLIARKECCTGWDWKTNPDGTCGKEFHSRNYSTGYIETKQWVRYGRFVAVCLLPDFLCAWPAFWLYNGNAPNAVKKWIEEIDIFEVFGKNPRKLKHIGITHHWGTSYNKGEHFQDGITVRRIKPYLKYHVYSVDWAEDYFEVSIDGMPIYRATENIPCHDLKVIFNLGIGTWGMPNIPFNTILGNIHIKRFLHLKL